MRALFLTLTLANLLFFGWSHWIDKPLTGRATHSSAAPLHGGVGLRRAHLMDPFVFLNFGDELLLLADLAAEFTQQGQLRAEVRVQPLLKGGPVLRVELVQLGAGLVEFTPGLFVRFCAFFRIGSPSMGINWPA